jgi:hypothetical protein
VEEETYTVQESARILRTTERTVRRRLERGGHKGARPHNGTLEGSGPFRHRRDGGPAAKSLSGAPRIP